MFISTPGNRLIVGLDYGTTYTGVSFCETTSTQSFDPSIQIIQDWESKGSMNATKEKVPSEIRYLPDGNIEWGSDIMPSKSRHKWTKLDLEAPKAGEAGKIRSEIQGLNLDGGRNPVDIVADFLAGVKKQLIMNLDRHFGQTLWRSLPMTLVVTVPAVWSDAAKDRTWQAVSKAGFTTVSLPNLERRITISEPEAAAIYTLRSLKGSAQEAQLKIGDCFVVCDMGGGTVDLISYQVTSTDPIMVQEATIGTGDQCGGSFVDLGFLKWLEAKLGIDDFILIAGCRADELSRTSLPPKIHKLILSFNLSAKSGFSGNGEFYITLPKPFDDSSYDEIRNITEGELTLQPEDLKEMFKYSLQRTRHLLENQLDMLANISPSVKYVYLVGGFSESPYMYNEIKAIMTKYVNIQVVRPSHAWSAIVRGAAVKGMEGNGLQPVEYRKCRRHYGTSCSSSFVQGRHREADAYIDQYTGEKRANNQMDWIFAKGQDLSTSKASHGFVTMSTLFWPTEKHALNLEFFAADVDKAPYRAAHPAYAVATLDIDLSRVPDNKWARKVGKSGRVYLSTEIEVHTNIQSALEFYVMIDGVKYGSVTANYA